ncbi:hypothetical protein H8B15_01425 [Hymenobacter sp. BT507]|uniref:Uncharacterized protein n=1 Tax=Hymenobacter citatus TaxID=2763506 RepID=A0ABR7MET1_9BACT|nr:hypothetical protein [Hymenobacter citatus]MBC6609561.1 hypothetical protein [Hymenobacter citatus]
MPFTPSTDTAEIIEKEAIPSLHFPTEDVLTDPLDRQRRQHDADRATALGNNYQGKVDIYFRTSDYITRRVHTSIWACHDNSLTLKAGVSLPLKAVLGFDFY